MAITYGFSQCKSAFLGKTKKIYIYREREREQNTILESLVLDLVYFLVSKTILLDFKDPWQVRWEASPAKHQKLKVKLMAAFGPRLGSSQSEEHAALLVFDQSWGDVQS